MGDNTGIEWTDATWNPIVGCSIVSPGCTNCYAMKFAGNRLDGNPMSSHYAGTTQKSKAGPVWSGKLALAPEHILTAPLRWKKPRRIFVNSMGDLFHEDCRDEWILDVLTVMAIARQHTFQVLTKRADRMRDFMSNPDLLQEIMVNWWSFDGGIRGVGAWPLPNVWLGVSAEDQTRADERLPHLVNTPAAVRFVSAEPLLGPLSLAPWLAVEQIRLSTGMHWTERNYDVQKIDWVIVGGESGPGARAMHSDWARSLRDQCAVAGLPFFFKQWGEWREPTPDGRGDPEYTTAKGRAQKTPAFFVAGDGTVHCFSTAAQERDQNRKVMIRVGKAKAGRLLDGREYNEMPEASS
jgi:protein gp37